MNPALKDLEIFIGEWIMEISNASFLPDVSTKIRGDTSFERIENGDYVIMHQGKKEVAPHYSTWLIGRDIDSSDYTILYSDDRGVSRVYQMSLNHGIWKIWRNSAKFSQRFEGKISADKKTISAFWEKSLDGEKWEHDFDLSYLKK